jgi:PAS domain S-box-containing protein
MKRYTSIEDLNFISESALESSLAGFWDWNIVTNEEYLSPRFKDMFGYSDHEMENSPESWQKIAFEEDLPGLFDSFNQHVASLGEIPFHSVVRYHHKDGQTVWVRCNGKVVEWSEKGEPIRAIGCHVNITEEKNMEEKHTFFRLGIPWYFSLLNVMRRYPIKRDKHKTLKQFIFAMALR